jgi:hypothetical protein
MFNESTDFIIAQKGEDAREKVVGQLRWLFDEKTAKQVLEGR